MLFGKVLKGVALRGVDQRAVAMMANAGFSDFAELDIAGHVNEDIELAVEFGASKVFRAAKSTSATDGKLYVRTAEDYTDGYVGLPLAAGEKDIFHAPITHIRKSGSISGVIVFWQELI
jgi:hypothetical protein